MNAITQIQPGPIWEAGQVARWLGYGDADHFLRKRERLHFEHGFPEPVPGLGRVMWSAWALAAWQASLIPPLQRQALAEMGVAFPIADLSQVPGMEQAAPSASPSERLADLDAVMRDRVGANGGAS